MPKQFEKSPISIQEQLQLLKDKKLTINNQDEARHFLEVVSFFRLKPYLRPFQNCAGDFKANIDFNDIIKLYDFDRRLRLLMIDAIERIEVGMRAIINDYMTTKYQDSHWYLQTEPFCDWYKNGEHNKFISKIEQKQEISKDNYTRYYTDSYCTPKFLPSWAMFEELSMTDLSLLFKALKNSDKKDISEQLGLPRDYKLLSKWLHSSTDIRNICAHHGRLWNKVLGTQPELPIEWNKTISKERIYIIFIIFNYLMQKISPASNWSNRLIELFNEFPNVDLSAMGMPEDWKTDFIKSHRMR